MQREPDVGKEIWCLNHEPVRNISSVPGWPNVDCTCKLLSSWGEINYALPLMGLPDYKLVSLQNFVGGP